MMEQRSISQQANDETSSPFQSFSDFTKSQPKLKMFEGLEIQNDSASPAVNRQALSLPQQQSPQSKMFLSPHAQNHIYRLQMTQQNSPISEFSQQITLQKPIYPWLKIIILLMSSAIFAVLLYKQAQFAALLQTLPEYKQSYPSNMRSSLWLKRYHQNLYEQETKAIQSIHENHVQAHNMSYFVNQMFRNAKQAQLYLQIQDVTNQKKLPFCICVLSGDMEEQQKIVKSVLQTNYQNYKIILLRFQKNLANSLSQNEYLHIAEISDFRHSTIMSIVSKYCIFNSLMMFIRAPVHPNIFNKFNSLHQTWNTYLTYTKKADSIQVHTFYCRVFQLLGLNDFQGTNQIFLRKGNLQVWTMGLLQLTSFKNKRIDLQQIYANEASRSGLLVNIINQKQYARRSYQPIKRLSEDLQKNIFVDNTNYKKQIDKLQKFHSIYIQTEKLSVTKLFKALQYQDFLYLPKNHSLSIRQLNEFDKHYAISAEQKNELPLCICILSHNNIADNRYKKVLLSIVQQQYSNYHIVFFDDQSTDQTFEKTIQYLKELRFPQQRAVFIKNLERKYATYNILNSAFNFCKEDDIQILVDGDDELIGWHVFDLIDGAYRNNPEKWVVYTNFKSNLYELGQSRPVPQKSQIISSDNKRIGGHYLGQLRTWKTKLLRAIPKSYHQAQGGYWLDTVYDDAIQHCIFELASVQRVMYLPQICYEYNRMHGDNDDSSQQKINNRLSTYSYLLSLPPLRQIYSEQQIQADQQMKDIFKKQLSSNTFKVVASTKNNQEHKQENQ